VSGSGSGPPLRETFKNTSGNKNGQAAMKGATDGLGHTNQGAQSLDANIRLQNEANLNRNIERLQQRFSQPASKGAQAGGFR